MAQPNSILAQDQAALVDIRPLLQRLWPDPEKELVTSHEIAEAIGHIFTNSLSPVQTGSLLTALHFTGWDRRADVLAKSSAAMRQASAKIDIEGLKAVVAKRGRKEGGYEGGLCDIVGTGGDSHNTFNISTTSSILASTLLLLSKHGNRASTSKSGSADLLLSMTPRAPPLSRITPQTITAVYDHTNYAFLFAPVFHPGMRYVAPIRKELGWRTIFNLLGPLANPVDVAIEARMLGVARDDLGPVFAEALRIAGAKKGLVVCGTEQLDEISCAGPTLCWQLVKGVNGTEVEHFTLTPEDFGLRRHPLSTVSPGKEPVQNAAILRRILQNEMPDDDPILEFVLLNTAALFVVSGICDADTSSMGEGDDGQVIQERGPGGGRWKEGVRRARWAIKSGEAWKMWESFVEVTNSFPG
ncbi:anthranilate phosphoribosyltransferase [Pseudomassariella vexata]|uniref:Anthranilate phosphoribosyltransferase n=1 Tax=Pseudomassariella vexata TaxID=1141098 RepID=A0A1Y2DT00_9PEZI|nr:anthranilate phosphoribosyltransferase [Pseudomassariella vexata]ORY62377.1 anthranilate phosphoribosyltransferase [Pseudomassariella vexata]